MIPTAELFSNSAGKEEYISESRAVTVYLNSVKRKSKKARLLRIEDVRDRSIDGSWRGVNWVKNILLLEMVDLSDPKSHEKFSVDVKLLLIPGVVLFLLVGK